MSDPVSNVEIEDVLSSIRRLVSTDHRHPVGQPDIKRAQDAEKLVLTPSLRVDPGQSKDKVAEEESELAGSVLGPETSDQQDRLSLADWQVEEQAEQGHDDLKFVEDDRAEPATEADFADDEANETDDLIKNVDFVDEPRFQHDGIEDAEEEPLTGGEVRCDAQQGAEDETADTLVEERWNEEDNRSDDDDDRDAFDISEEFEPEDHGTTELEARIAEVEAAVAARQDEWEPDGDADDAYAGASVAPLPWADHSEDLDPVTDFAHHSETSPASSHLVEDAQDGTDDVYDASPGMSQGEVAPDPSESTDEQKGGSIWYGDDTVIDEEALRDLVSDIVRQELQGALGERITRNVRKLVRREIHRALMSQDFD